MRVLPTTNIERVKLSIRALKHDPHFQDLQEYLATSIQTLYKRKDENEVRTRWNEGAEMVIEDLLNLIQG